MDTNQNNSNLNQNNVSNNQNLSGTTPTTPVNQAQPVNTQSPQVAPAQTVVASPSVAPVSQTTPVTPTNEVQPQVQAATQVQNQNASPVVTQTVASTESQVVVPAVAPTTQSTPSVQTVTPPPQVVAPQAVTPQTENEAIVINTTKKKTSNIIVFVLVILMILFAFNLDTVLDMINNYINNGTISNNNNTNTDNLSNGYIMINESSNMSLEEIKFYNFRTKEDSVEVTFNYEVNKKHENAADLKIYIELYNSDKELIYRELFDPQETLEVGTIHTYSLNLTNDIYTSAFYALVKEYTEQEENSTSKMVCKLNDSNDNVTINYEITYNFKNNGLTSYEVNKNYKLKDNDVTDNYVIELDKEYESVKDKITSVSYENNTLKYTVDFSNDIEGFIPLYNKDAIINAIKEKETMKKWVCE